MLLKVEMLRAKRKAVNRMSARLFFALRTSLQPQMFFPSRRADQCQRDTFQPHHDACSGKRRGEPPDTADAFLGMRRNVFNNGGFRHKSLDVITQRMRVNVAVQDRHVKHRNPRQSSDVEERQRAGDAGVDRQDDHMLMPLGALVSIGSLIGFGALLRGGSLGVHGALIDDGSLLVDGALPTAGSLGLCGALFNLGSLLLDGALSVCGSLI